MRKIGKINVLVCICLLLICIFTKSTVLAADYYPEIPDSGSSSVTPTGNKPTNSSKVTLTPTSTPTPTKSTKQDTADTNHPQTGVYTNVCVGIILVILAVSVVAYIKFSKYNF